MNFISLSVSIISIFCATSASLGNIETQLGDIFDLGTFLQYDFLILAPKPSNQSVDSFSDTFFPKKLESLTPQLSTLYLPFEVETRLFTGSENISVKIFNWETIHEMLHPYSRSPDKNESLIVVIFPESTTDLPKIVQSIAKIKNPSFYFIVQPDSTIEDATQENSSICASSITLEAAQYSDWGKDIYLISDEMKSQNESATTDDLSNYQISEIYSSHSGIPYCQVIRFSQNKITLVELLNKTTRRTDMSGTALKTGAVLKNSDFRTNYTNTTVDGESSLKFNGGIDIEFWQYIADSYNFSTIPVDGIRYTTKAPRLNKTDYDIGTQVQRKQIDIAITPHELNAHRAKKFSFLQSNCYLTLCGFFIQPPASTIRDIFIQAFKTDLWVAMFSTWILIVVGIMSLAWVKKRVEDLQENEETILSEALLWATGAICQQGWHVCPESTSMKIIFISGLFTGLVSYVAYSAALVSILSLDIVPIRGLSDVQSSKYKFYADELVIGTDYVMEQITKERPELIPKDSIINIPNGIKRIFKQSAIFIGIEDEFYPRLQENFTNPKICSTVSKINVNRIPIRIAMFVKKGSPLKEYFNTRILWMFNCGMRYRLLAKYLRNTSITCLAETENQKQPLGMNDVFTAFAILLAGYAASIAVFVIEKIVFKKKIEPPSMAMVTNDYFKDINMKNYYY